jgi:hypothetical protein
MPRFYFHVRDDVDVRDETGKELQDLAAAVAYSMEQARYHAVKAINEKGSVVAGHRIDIEDKDGHVLDSVPFADVATAHLTALCHSARRSARDFAAGLLSPRGCPVSRSVHEEQAAQGLGVRAVSAPTMRVYAPSNPTTFPSKAEDG